MLVWKPYSRMIDALAFSPCGRTLAVGGYYLACRLIDATTGERIWSEKGNCTFGSSLAFAPQGAVLCRQAGVSIRSATDGSQLRKCGRWCQSFGASADGNTVIVADNGFQDIIRRYDLKTGEAHRDTELLSGAINRIAVSPDGKLVAVLGCKRFYLLTADNFDEVAAVPERALSSGSFALRFSPCGRTIAFTAGHTLILWDVASSREVNRIQLQSKHCMDAAFTPDGRHLITVCKQGTARVWDTTTWACERSFAWRIGPLRAVAVAPDGTRAATAGDTGRVVVWDMDA